MLHANVHDSTGGGSQTIQTVTIFITAHSSFPLYSHQNTDVTPCISGLVTNREQVVIW